MLGRHMRRVQFATVFLVSLTLGLSLDVPMEDLSDTVFDESETLPYESTPLFRITVQVSSRIPQPVLKLGSPFHLGSLTRRCERRPEHRSWSAHPVSDSLTILDHSLRC